MDDHRDNQRTPINSNAVSFCLYGASKIVQIYFEFSETLSDHKILSDYHPKKILDGAFVNSRILPGTLKFC